MQPAAKTDSGLVVLFSGKDANQPAGIWPKNSTAESHHSGGCRDDRTYYYNVNSTFFYNYSGKSNKGATRPVSPSLYEVYLVDTSHSPPKTLLTSLSFSSRQATPAPRPGSALVPLGDWRSHRTGQGLGQAPRKPSVCTLQEPTNGVLHRHLFLFFSLVMVTLTLQAWQLF